jgi:hypothetical protein
VWAECRVQYVKQVVHIVTAGLERVKSHTIWLNEHRHKFVSNVKKFKRISTPINIGANSEPCNVM